MKNKLIILLLCIITSYAVKGQNNLVPGTNECNSVSPPFDFTITEAWTSKTGNKISALITPLVGDIDGDGRAEVFATSEDGSTLYIFDGKDGSLITSFAINGSALASNIVLCNVGGKGAIFNAGAYGVLKLFTVSSAPGVRPITFTTKWTNNTGITLGASMPIVADLDGDGIPEFIAAGRIIDSETGSILANLTYKSYPGMFDVSYHTALDLDDDGLPEIIAGPYIYKFNRSSNPKAWIWKELKNVVSSITNSNNFVSLGADVNQDGVMDMVTTDENGSIYIWTPKTGALIGSIINKTTSVLHDRAHSYPFIGDVDGVVGPDGKKYPEIILIRQYKVIAYKYNPGYSASFTEKAVYNAKTYTHNITGSNFSLKWLLETTDGSGGTGITLFDFNNDGVMELVYRDEHKVRIFDGSKNSIITRYERTCGSTTGHEAPVIADVTGDGSADIIVAGHPTQSAKTFGEVMAFEGGASKWASAPNVWNQQLYSPLHVNTDLTVPLRVKSLNLTYTRPDGSKVQFYNGGPMQAPLVDDFTYLPMSPSSDIYVISGNITTTNNSATITITFGNRGNATATANIPIQYYKTSIAQGNIIGSEILGVDVPPGETHTITKTINNLNPMPVQFFVRALDDGINFPATGRFSDCDLTNNTKPFGTIELTKEVTYTTECLNSISVFTIKVKNNETRARNDIIVIDSLSAGWEFISAASTTGATIGTYDFGNRKVIWSISSLAPGEEAEMTVIAKAAVTGDLRNVAWIESVNGATLGIDHKSAYIIVANRQAPSAPVITYSDLCSSPVQLHASGAGTFQWYHNGIIIAGVTSNTYNATQTGSYRVTVHDGNCISDISDPLEITFNCTELNDDYATVKSGNEITIPVLDNDILTACENGELTGDIKALVKNALASSYQQNEDIDKSVDGDMGTLYHSNWNGTQMPVTLEYFFENIQRIDYLIYHPRTSGINGIFKTFELWITTEDNPTYTHYRDYDFGGSNQPSRIDFTNGILKPTAIKLIVKTAVSDTQGKDFVSCAEMEFYQKRTPYIMLEPVLGTAGFNADSTLKYIAYDNATGLDYLDYALNECSGNGVNTARVYIAVLKPFADEYTACPESPTTMGFEPINGVTFNWYNTQTDGNIVPRGSSTNSLTITKGSAEDIGTWWVEVSVGGKVYPSRQPVELSEANYCNLNCAEEGTLLFREDFGGNKVNHPRVSQSPLPPGRTDYIFSNTNSNEEVYDHLNKNLYWLLKYNVNKTAAFWPGIGIQLWQTDFSDHTFPNDTTRGYMFMADLFNGQSTTLYEHTISDLCGGSRLFFSVRLINILTQTAYEYGFEDDPNLKFEIWNNNTVLATYETGTIPRDSIGNPQWKLYGFPFDVPSDISSVTLKITNNNIVGWEGNDFAMDDIEIRLCVPPVNIIIPEEDNISVCEGEAVNFTGNYDETNNPVYTVGNTPLVSRWEYSKNGNMDDSGAWSVVKAEETENPGSFYLHSIFSISNVTAKDQGYYRLVVANANSINSNNCKAISRIIYLEVKESQTYPDIRVKACPQNIIELNKYIVSDDVKLVKWSPEDLFNNNGIDDGTLKNATKLTPNNTYRFKYSIVNGCNIENRANLYLTVKNTTQFDIDVKEVKFCYENAATIYLNPILGIETEGTWGCIPNEAGNYLNNAILDGKAIWNDSKLIFDDEGNKTIIITFTPSNTSCFSGKIFTFMVILTDTLIM